MTEVVFVDTNILIYARDTSEPEKHRTAATCIERLWREQRGRTSMQVLNEYYVTVTRKLKPGLHVDAAWDDVQSFLAWEPYETNRALLLAAREIERRYRISWWDSLIVGAAQLQHCSTLITEDLQDGMHFESVVIQNPFKMKVRETAVPYRSGSALPSRHRGRGRPRRAARD